MNGATHSEGRSTDTIPGTIISNLKRNTKELRKPDAKRPKVNGAFMASKADVSICAVECNPQSHDPI